MDYSSILSKPKSFFGKQKVWMARGEDLALFNTHRPNIQNLLRHSCIPESSHNLWIGLYRVGVTEDEAKTFIVVSCSDRSIRKLTRDILSSCPIFQPGEALDRFKVISKATLPETACEPQRTMQDEGDMSSETRLLEEGKDIATAMTKPKTTICLRPSHTGDNYLCREIRVYKEGQPLSRTATAGPLILLNGCTYQLTVAHVVDSVDFKKDEGHDTAESTVDDWDDWSDEESENTSRCSVDEDVASWNISVRRNRTPDTCNDESTDGDNSEHSSSDAAPKVATEKDNFMAAPNEATLTSEEPTGDTVRLFPSPISSPSEQPVFEDFIVTQYFPSQITIQSSIESCQVSSEMDYLLIPTKDDRRTLAYESGNAELVQVSEAFDLKEQTEPRPILIATALFGYIEGMVFPAPSLLRSPGSKAFQTLYCIESNNTVPKGTSGSAVFDKQTGLLAGHIVLGCPEKNIWYMVPIGSVLRDLEVRFGQKGNCQIQIDVAAAMGLNVIEMVTASFGELSQSSLLGGLGVQHEQESSTQMLSKPSTATQGGRFKRPGTSILKGLQRETTDPIDDWSERFGQKPHSTERDKQLLGSFRDPERVFLKAMALMLLYPYTALEDHQVAEILQTGDSSFLTTDISEAIMTCREDEKNGLQPTAWMLDIFRPLVNKGKALNKRELVELLQGKV
ncbi:hypothetical protein FGLOB1_12328 [Fusarium globosum]|uniref:Uncharacterized protein n=1 Tax=Fusarium globosum TaxID=78864 RepID=A0A8H6CZH1_9HYPO|nr:hypothetical protein FGLOB1_12328 [Fusarium globosum]